MTSPTYKITPKLSGLKIQAIWVNLILGTKQEHRKTINSSIS